ncbi:MAG: glycosyltransferase [Anaerolineales bacterium]|nr:glycosyltransferase [Anaerolineales bacterium]
MKTGTELPLVSIVTPSFNQASFLEATLNSVLEQDYPHLEYLIVDGGSTDGSREIIEKYADHLAWWVSEPDQGQTDAINKGFAHAQGDILAWLNSDDTYKPGAITAAVNFLQENPEVGLVYGSADYINEQGIPIGQFPAAQTNLRRLRQGYVHIPQQSAFFRANLWKQVGPLDPTFYFAMDYDLWVRLASVSKIQHVKQNWANFRMHRVTKSMAEDNRCWPEMLRVHYRDGGSPFALIVGKYWLRKIIAPLWTWRRRRKLGLD